MTTATEDVCTCGPGAWGTCDHCGVDAWIKHHCPFPCDDVTCEDGRICIGCLTGRPCLVHNGDEYEDDGSLALPMFTLAAAEVIRSGDAEVAVRASREKRKKATTIEETA